MHIIVTILVILIFIALITLAIRRPSSTEQHNSNNSQQNINNNNTNHKIVFISKGKLFYSTPSNNIEQIHSPYIQEMIDRAERRKQLHGWKENTSLNASFTGMNAGGINDQVNLQISASQFISDDQLIYFIKDNSVGGLFSYNINTQEELRLIHQQNLDYKDFAYNQSTSELLCSQVYDNEISNIIKLAKDGSHSQALTEGDTVDTSPAWLSGDNQKILYQSSGLARSEDGFAIATGPSAIKLLDLESNNVTSVLEDEKVDYMQPKVDSMGNLYFIRRPYEIPKYHTHNAILDMLFFPFRLLRAVFHYLNFFSLMYSQKPLTTASGPKLESDLQDIIIKGKRINAEKALSKANKVNGIPSLVPRTWELVKRSTHGEDTVLAANVASYDITNDDQILFSNGYAVFVISTDNHTDVVLRDKVISEFFGYSINSLN